jgi:hypothetical protein
MRRLIPQHPSVRCRGPLYATSPIRLLVKVCMWPCRRFSRRFPRPVNVFRQFVHSFAESRFAHGCIKFALHVSWVLRDISCGNVSELQYVFVWPFVCRLPGRLVFSCMQSQARSKQYQYPSRLRNRLACMSKSLYLLRMQGETWLSRRGYGPKC